MLAGRGPTRASFEDQSSGVFKDSTKGVVSLGRKARFEARPGSGKVVLILDE